MFRIVYLAPNGNYLNVEGHDHTKIDQCWNSIERSGNEIITIYDYSRNVQLYRCTHYEFHRQELIDYLTENKLETHSRIYDLI